MTFSFILFCSNLEPTGPHCCHINQTEKDRVWVPAGGCHFSIEEAGTGSCVNRLTFPVPLLLPQQSAASSQWLPQNSEPSIWENATVLLEHGEVRICPQDL